MRLTDEARLWAFRVSLEPEVSVARRVETVEFEDDGLVRRSSRLEIDLPETLVGQQVAVPLGFHDRDHTSRRVVTGPDGTTMPTLGRAEERSLVAFGFAARSVELDEAGQRPDLGDGLTVGRRWAAILAAIRNVEATDLDDSFAELDRAFTDNIGLALMPYKLRRLVMATFVCEEADRVVFTEAHTEPVSHPQGSWRSLRLPMQFELQVAELVDAQQMVVKVNEGSPVGDADRPWAWKTHVDDYPLSVPAMNPEGAASFHLEVVAPPGTYVHEARLVTWLTNTADDVPADSSTVLVTRDRDIQHDTCRFHLDPTEERLTVETVIECSAALVLRPRYGGVLRGGFVVSVLTTFILWGVAITSGWYSSGWQVGVAVATPPDVNSVVAVLLLAPGVALGLMLKEREHPITAAVLWSFKARLVLLEGLTVAVALIVAMRAHGSWVGVAELAAALGSTVLTWINGSSALRSRAATIRPAFGGPGT